VRGEGRNHRKHFRYKLTIIFVYSMGDGVVEMDGEGLELVMGLARFRGEEKTEGK
jgi:hypothetical protein